jgi:signal transduction histidine kinase
MAASAGALPRLAQRVAVTPDRKLVCDPLLKELHYSVPRFLNIAVLDRQGRLACSALPADRQTFRPAPQEEWFETTVTERKSVVSGPRIGRITNRWISTLSHPIFAPEGGVAGSIVVSIDLVDFEPIARQAALPAEWVAGIVQRDGTIVGRSHDPARWIGSGLLFDVESMIAPEERSGHWRAVGTDGVERLYAAARVPNTDWIAYAGLESKAILLREREQLVELATLAALLIGIAAFAAFIFGRRISVPMRAMADAARAVAAGEARPEVPVSGPREVREVANEFNRMVAIRDSAERDARELATRTRELSRKLAAVEQVERQRIHRELHDRIGQNLALLNLGLDIAATQIPDDCGDAVKPRLREARAIVQTTIAHVRNVMAELRPPALDEYGLAAALRAYVASVQATTDLLATFEGRDVVPRPSALVESTLFRIAQEAVTNTAKHAAASRVTVRVVATAEVLTLSITDDGKGFDASDPTSDDSKWGVTTMRERAEAIGARLRIASEPGHGTAVIVEADL